MKRTVCPSCRRQRLHPQLFQLAEMGTFHCEACGHVFERRVDQYSPFLREAVQVRLPTASRPVTLRY